MTSYEIGSNSSRYPYDYSFVTDGTNGEYTDTTETSFILPTITAADANKFLEVNDTATGYQYTGIEGELPPQAGQTGNFLQTNGTDVSWQSVNQVPTPSGTGQILNSTGAGTYSFTDNPTIDIIRTGSGSSSGLRIGNSNTGVYGLSSTNVIGVITSSTARQTWDSAGSTISVPLTCTNTVTLNNGLSLTFSSQASNRTLTQTDNTFQRMNFSSNDVIYTLPVLNNGTMFYFNPFSNVGSTFGAYLQGGTGGTGGVQNFETYYNGVRTQISNAGQTGNPSTPAIVRLEAGSIYQCIYFASLGNWHIYRLGITQQVNFTGGSATVPSISFNDPPGVTGNTASGIYGADNSVSVTTNGTERLTVNNNGVASSSRFISTRGLTITNGYSFNGTDISGLYASTSDFTMHLVSNTVPVLSVLNVGGAGGTGGTSTATVTGNLVVTGTISGSAPAQVSRRVQIVAPGDSNPVVYDSTNPNPPTTVISTSITSNKLVTLGNLGAAYDGFEMEYSLQGVGNTFGVWFTFVDPRGILFPREGRPRITNTVANTSTNAMWGSTGYFNKCVNNFRARATFVWAGGANDCYWIVRDVTDYTQRLSTLNLNTGSLTISKETARHVLVRRNVATTITFPNLSTVGGNTHDADGFEVRIVAYRVASDTPNTVTIENTSGTTMFFITSNTTTEIANNGTQQFVSSKGSAQMDCVYRLDNASNYCWIITKYAG